MRHLADIVQPEELLEELPHGSGIDLPWGYSIRGAGTLREEVRFMNAFHLMNEHGGYVSWQDFTLVIHRLRVNQVSVVRAIPGPVVCIHGLAGDIDFRIEFNGGERHHTRASDLRGYLEETFAHFLGDHDILSPSRHLRLVGAGADRYLSDRS